MLVRDPLSDLFTRIRNACLVKHSFTIIPFSRVKLDIIKILKEEGFVEAYTIENDGLVKKNIKVHLKYDKDGQPVIMSIRCISKLSKRIYVKKKNIPRTMNGFGITIVSTSSGMMTGKKSSP